MYHCSEFRCWNSGILSENLRTFQNSGLLHGLTTPTDFMFKIPRLYITRTDDNNNNKGDDKEGGFTSQCGTFHKSTQCEMFHKPMSRGFTCQCHRYHKSTSVVWQVNVRYFTSQYWLYNYWCLLTLTKAIAHSKSTVYTQSITSSPSKQSNDIQT